MDQECRAMQIVMGESTARVPPEILHILQLHVEAISRVLVQLEPQNPFWTSLRESGFSLEVLSKSLSRSCRSPASRLPSSTTPRRASGWLGTLRCHRRPSKAEAFGVDSSSHNPMVSGSGPIPIELNR